MNEVLISYLTGLGKNSPVVVAAVLGLGWLYGKLGATGKMQLLYCFATGLVFGGAMQVAIVGLPADFTGWFWVVITAVVMGLMPSGVYEAVKEAQKKAGNG